MNEDFSNRHFARAYHRRNGRTRMLGAVRHSRPSRRPVRSDPEAVIAAESVRQLMICLGWLRLFQRILLGNSHPLPERHEW